MADNRFPSVGVDARFPLPVGTDVRFPSPGTDLEHLPDGTDTRFQGSTYGGAVGSPPVISVAPVVSGAAVRGSTLSCTTGTWSQSPGGGTISYAYQWTRDGADIGGATASTYATVMADVGAAVGCKVTATDTYGASSAATATGAVTVISFSAAVQAILAGTTGFALDPTDASTMWQDTGTATPVTTIGDPVGHIRTKWGNAQYDFIQATASARPAWDGVRFLDPDGVDDLLQADGSYAVLQNATGYFGAIRHNGDNPANQALLYISTAANTDPRFQISRSTGRARWIGRRLDADVNTDVQGTDAFNWNTSTVSYEINLQGTTNAIWLRKDNADVTNLTMGGVAGNSENTASARMRLGNTTWGAAYGRMVVLPRVPTADERAIIQSWLMEV